MMTLAAILEVCLLTLSPSARRFIVPAFSASQTGLVQQDTPPASPQTPAQEPDSKPTPEQTTPPANAPAETQSNPEAQPVPATATPPSQEPANPQAAPPAEKPKTPAPKKRASSASKAKTAAAKKRHKHVASQPPAGPPKVVVKNGSTADPSVKISPSLSQQQASSQRQASGRLLANTDANLKKVSGHPLTASQQDMVKQIQQYMEQAKTAGDAGDLEREHNLALKANLLSAELVKH